MMRAHSSMTTSSDSVRASRTSPIAKFDLS
jgi:hypothetical protein